MYRRRRRREHGIAFGLDSFLDVITNVIGIIIRMILVVWVSARAYHLIQYTNKANELELPPAETKKISDPLEQEIAHHRQELQQVRQDLLQHLRQLPAFASKQQKLQQKYAGLASQKNNLQTEKKTLHQTMAQQNESSRRRQSTLDELRRRHKRLKEEIARLEQKPITTKVFRYHAPVSRPVKREELFFECKNGRVSFIDITAFVEEVKDNLQRDSDKFRELGELKGATRPIGPFRLRYTLKRGDELLRSYFGGSDIDFHMEVEPIADRRGETAAQALRSQSQFRQIVDFADPRHAVITFWVYPDSFAVYRQLRNYLYQRNIDVAARPLPFGISIGMSPKGSKSRGQ